MTLILPGLLFASLLTFLLLVLVPGEDAAPASVTLDYVRRSFMNRYAGDRSTKLAILGKTTGDAFRFSLAVSIAAGLLGFLPAFFKWRWLALIVGVAFFVSGFLLSQHAVKNEFKKWQARVFGDVPTLISFAPSFLRVGGITLRDAISMTVPFLSGPLRDEVWTALDRIRRTGHTRDAFDELAERVDHPVMDAICLRLSTAWDASPSPGMFDDLSDQMQDMEEIDAAGATAGKAGMLALICVLSLLGAVLVFGYPAGQYLMAKMSMGFGG